MVRAGGLKARGAASESGGSEDAGACADGNWMANPAMQNRMGTASMPGRDCASIIGAVGCAAHVAPKHSSLLVSELCPKSCRAVYRKITNVVELTFYTTPLIAA